MKMWSRLLVVIVIGFWFSGGLVTKAGATEFGQDYVSVATDKTVYRVNEPIQIRAVYTNIEERQWLWCATPGIRRFEAIALINPLDKSDMTPPLSALGLQPVFNISVNGEFKVQVDSHSEVVIAHRVLSYGLSKPGLYIVKLNVLVRNNYYPYGDSLLVASPSIVIEVK